ncbi:MAG: HAMP domain-containing protein [Blastococcus sp.]
MLCAEAAGLSWLVAGRIVAPLATMTTTARRLSADNLHERLALTGPEDELKYLADTFDRMLGRLEAAFEGQRRFVGNASHELRTPLTLIGTEIDGALRNPDSSPDESRRPAVVRRLPDRLHQSGSRAPFLIWALLRHRPEFSPSA